MTRTGISTRVAGTCAGEDSILYNFRNSVITVIIIIIEIITPSARLQLRFSIRRQKKKKKTGGRRVRTISKEKKN